MTPVGGSWPWADAEPAVLFDRWTSTQHWRLTATDAAPPAPTGAAPVDWTAERPETTTSLPYRWVSTRKGSECAGYTWTPPMQDDHTIYRRWNSSTPPPRPSGIAEIPSGWSTAKEAATSSQRYVYCLTVSFENGVWNDWSTGALVLFDQWTVTQYWRLTATNSVPATPAVPEPEGWVAMADAPTDQMAFRWKSTRSGSPCAGYTWTAPVPAPVPDLNIVATNYAYKLAASRPATPSVTSYPPPGWSTTDLEPSELYIVWRTEQTVTNEVASGWSFPVSWKWLECVYKLASSQPPSPTDSTLPDWSEDVPNQTETMRVWRSCRTITSGMSGLWSTPETVFPDPRTVYKLASSKPATPNDRLAYPPPGWSLVELEPTTSFNLWQSTQVFVYGIYAPWGEPRFVRGHTGPRYAYKRAASQPATPTSREWPPPGWRAERLRATSSEDVWQTTQMLTNGVPSVWSTPVLFEVRE